MPQTLTNEIIKEDSTTYDDEKVTKTATKTKSRNNGVSKAQTMKNVFANSSKKKTETLLNVIDESKDEEVPKDKFGATPSLRQQIEKKYEMIEVIGKGSYGCVTRGKCKKTGRQVAIKIMQHQTDSEYDTIKLVREV